MSVNAPVSIREVAARAGVSVGTVSNVLNRPDIVARSTRDRVQEAIKALGFVRNESARQLRAAGLRAGAQIAALPPGRRPTGVFCANDLIALGLLQEMTLCRIAVPGDIAIVGYDDIDFAAAAAVPLSSVRQPRQQLGRTAARLLLEETMEPARHTHQQVMFKPELEIRQSSQNLIR